MGWRERALAEVPEAQLYPDDFGVNRALGTIEAAEHHPDFGTERDYRIFVQILKQFVQDVASAEAQP